MRREDGAHTDSVRARDPGLRMPSSSGRAINASFAEISDDTRIRNRDRLSSRSSRVWTIVGYLRCLVTCVEIKILRRVLAESPRRPPRHRRDACSMAWRCRFLTARPSQDGRSIAEK